MHSILILKNQVHLSEFSSSTFLLPSVPYNHTSWHANFWNSTLIQLPRLILWIVDCFVSRSQTVRHQAAFSSSRSISTGSPQGTVLSPILFTLCTNDCTGTETTPIIKYCDDSAIEDLFNTDSVYFAEAESFSYWCRDNSFELNVKPDNKGNVDWF